jgi:ribonuclease-3
MGGEARRQRMRALLARAGASRAEPAAFDAAFIHGSAAAEGLAERSNERLEFLGDALLGFVVARALFERYPAAAEGELALRKSSLVSDLALADTAERLGFEALLVLGGGLAKALPARRRSALADAFEAFLAVLHRECGLDTVAAFVAREHVTQRESLGLALDDPKTILQEWMQRRFATVPAYADAAEGPAHERLFRSQVTVAEVRTEGTGPTKRAAQRAAAAAALAELALRYDDVVPRALSQSVAAPPRAKPAPVKPRARLKKAATGPSKRPHA